MPQALKRCALAIACLLSGCEVGTQPPEIVETVERPASKPAESQTDFQSQSQPQLHWQSQSPSAPPLVPVGPGVARGYLQFVTGYREGYNRGLAEGKPMLVFFTARWCHFCHQMANEAFTHGQVVDLSQRFVCILVDADAEPEVCEQFGVRGYPTIQFLSPRGVPMNRIVGKKPGHQLMMAMQAALQNIARRAETAPGRG